MEALIASLTVIMAVDFFLVLRALWRLEKLAEELRDAAHGIEDGCFRLLRKQPGGKRDKRD